MASVCLSFGSNIEPRVGFIEKALAMIVPFFTLEKKSSFFESLPQYYHEQEKFINMVACGVTKLSPHELLIAIKEVERRVGREKTFRNGPRQIDIDILFYDDLVINDDLLTLPHPRFFERDFVLVPLLEIEENKICPLTNIPLKQMVVEEFYQSLRKL